MNMLQGNICNKSINRNQLHSLKIGKAGLYKDHLVHFRMSSRREQKRESKSVLSSYLTPEDYYIFNVQYFKYVLLNLNNYNIYEQHREYYIKEGNAGKYLYTTMIF